MIRSVGMILNKPLMNFERKSDMISFRIHMASYDLISIYTNEPQQNLLFDSLNGLIICTQAVDTG